MARGSSEVVVILWRDIPAQVNAQIGRERKQIQLSDKFQRAIDRAKRKAHIYTANEDIAQWRRVSEPLVGELAHAAERKAAELESRYSAEYLGRLAFAHGLESQISETSIQREQLSALEELDENQ